MKYVRLAVMGLVLAAAVIAGYQLLNERADETGINSFEQCAAAGYPIQESYPERCTTPDGQSFTRP